MPRGLSAKQEKFLDEYVLDFNGKQAAIRAGYAHSTAKKRASEILATEAGKARLAEIARLRREAYKPTVDRVLEELSRIAFFDVRKIFDEEGNLRPVEELDEDTARAIAGVEVTQMADGNTKTKVRTIDKSKALETLARHLGMLVDRVQHEGNVGQVVIMLPDNGRQIETHGGTIDGESCEIRQGIAGASGEPEENSEG